LDRDGNPCPRPQLDAGQFGISALYRLYRCREGWLCIAAVAEAHWQGLCAALGRGLAVDPRFATPDARAAHDGALAVTLEATFAAADATTWSDILDSHGVPCEVSVSTFNQEMFDDEHMRAAGLVVSYPHGVLGRLEQAGHLIGFSETPGRIFGPPPASGEHTREILVELGYSRPEIEELERAGAVASAELPLASQAARH
jgi:crotonobetainyl-CoA:carnitine CoA-transferase CaiB-like acyl-CoA transferase